MANITPIFVLGSPRSGTTLISAFLGTSKEIIDFGELGVFYFARWVSRREYKRSTMLLREDYFRELENHAVDFAVRKTEEVFATYFCDSTPFNLRIADFLATTFPNAIFVLTLRHYSGVIQSLERSFADGRRWAGETVPERALIWKEVYSYAPNLPFERTVPISFDRLCLSPQLTIDEFVQRLGILGVPTHDLSLSAFCKSHATTKPRSTIGVVTNDGETNLQSIPSFDRFLWLKSTENDVSAIVSETENMLKQLFPQYYYQPVDWGER
ncbi:MAG: sulfotransferase [Anaerolineales bacterium]|nr:sulfotransferase [Anaerolineales bacterium]